MLSRSDFLASFDLANQFFHVRLAEADRKFFGFAFPDETGQLQYYQFKVMAYGFSPAVSVVTRLLKPVKAYLHELGIKLSIYVDDGRLGSQEKVEAEEQLRFSLQVLQLCGWNVQWEKTALEASQQHLHLGFVTDTVSMKYFYPQGKVETVNRELEQAIRKGLRGEKFGAKELAKLLGRLQSMRRSHGDIVRVMSRSCQHDLGKVVVQHGWHASLVLSAGSVEELKFLKQHLEHYNGQFIQIGRAHV